MDLVTGKLIVDALKLAYDLLKSASGLKPKDKKKIQHEVEKIIRIATPDEVDKYVAEPRRVQIERRTKGDAAQSLEQGPSRLKNWRNMDPKTLTRKQTAGLRQERSAGEKMGLKKTAQKKKLSRR
jgi:hypothetical protein